MSNDEAIEILKSKMDGSVDTSYEWCEAIRLAINALEAQSSERMSEYIKREDAIGYIKHVYHESVKFYEVDEEEVIDSLVEALNALPSADVEPVRHGHWIRESVGSDNSSEGYFKISMAECSECGTCVMGKPNYCPNCGARMDGEEE